MSSNPVFPVPFDYESLVTSDFFHTQTESAVYMHGKDDLLGPVVAVIYKPADSPKQKLSAIFVSSHGVSCFEDMTLDESSRYYGACDNLADIHKPSLVRRAVAIAGLRAYASISSYNRAELLKAAKVPVYDWDDTVAGSLASSMKLMKGKFPKDIGDMIRRLGLLQTKQIRHSAVDLVYEDSDSTIDLNNELVYLFGTQLEHLFDPVCEYSPEPAELLYTAPDVAMVNTDNEKISAICNELFLLQTHFRDDLVDFLENFLIPLRVGVLGGEVADMTIRKLNTIFPPTIEEIVRINKIFYQALEQTMEFGSFEMIKACGMTIPYFYKACMRHEAASQNFSKTLKYQYPALKKYLKKYSARKIESIIHCSIHLTKIKMILDRLLDNKIQQGVWTGETISKAQNYYESAIETIDAFGKVSIEKYRRVFTPTGKMLVEVADNWPKELEYGWVNRRVVSIFDGISLLDNNEEHVIIIFTDYVVILKAKEKWGNSAREIHSPSIADQLFHCLTNEKPLDNIPELQVIGWCDSDQIILSELGESSIQLISKDSRLSVKIYRLTSKTSSNVVELAVKAKIMNKCQPFHLFCSNVQDFQCFGTVHEINDYFQEIHKAPIAFFMNVAITHETLDANGLKAAISVEVVDQERNVQVTGYTKFGYDFDQIVSIEEFSDFLMYEIGQLHKLLFSRANEEWRETITRGNKLLVEFLVKYGAKGGEPTKKREKVKILRGSPDLSDDLFLDVPESDPFPELLSSPDQPFSSHHFNLSSDSILSGIPSGIPSPNSAPSLSLSLSDTPPLPDLANKKSKLSTEHLKPRYGNLASDDEDYVDWEDASDSSDNEDAYDSDGERQQRDVEEWYEALAQNETQQDLDSLDSVSVGENAEPMYRVGDFDCSFRQSESTPSKGLQATDGPRTNTTTTTMTTDDTLLYDDEYSYLADYLEK